MSIFTELRLNYNQYEFYFPRKRILNFLDQNLDCLKGNLLDVGCGKKPYKSVILKNKAVTDYTGLDIENSLDYGGEKPEIFWKDNKIPASDNTFDSAIATEVFEHVHNIQEVVREIYRVMQPGADFLITIPFLWPLHETPHDHYRYTPFAIEKLLVDAGFKVTKLEGMGGWNASMGLMLTLWVKRAFKRKIAKLILFILTYPIVWLLFKTDRRPMDFKESTMITGLGIIARK
ncbi:MAG: class I SAM-dependent methyltransferase [Saprospiraceae bacterium]|nr:class I SAM-dependent methyltransferase [Saprospiraceae bacterium]